MLSNLLALLFLQKRVLFLYADGKSVNHIAPYIDKYKYNFCCGITVGAVVGFTGNQFEDLNGFSNQYEVTKK